MAKLMRLQTLTANILRLNLKLCSRVLSSGVADTRGAGAASDDQEKDRETHTGQVFISDDYRRSRYLDCDKYVNPNFAIDLIKEEPVIVCTARVIASQDGGVLGHPRLYINLDQPGYHICGYSGRRFVLKKHYDEKTMGPSITYDQYLEQIGVSEEEEEG